MASRPVALPARFRRLGPAYEQIAAQLRDSILTGELPQGSRLPSEEELRIVFGVSRSTIRDTLRGLAAEGLITTSQGVKGGSFVTLPSMGRLSDSLHVGLSLLSRSDGASIEEFMELRELLEVPAAGLAAVRRTPGDVERLADTLPGRSPAPEDGEQFEQNHTFHLVLVEIAHNRLLELTAGPLLRILHGRMEGVTMSKAQSKVGARHHRAITEAIERGDAEESEQLIREHMAWLRLRYHQLWTTSEGSVSKGRTD